MIQLSKILFIVLSQSNNSCELAIDVFKDLTFPLDEIPKNAY